ASRDTPRRHHRLPRQPNTATASATPVRVTQMYSDDGAGSPASPSESMYQCAHAARTRPTATETGSHTNRHRRDRHPAATTSTTAATAHTVGGSQPCSNDSPPRYPAGACAAAFNPVVTQTYSPTVL